MKGETHLMNDIYTQIAKNYDAMSKTYKKIADYILKNPVAASFLTVGKLACQAGVSEASIIRFANFLGFSGYSALQKVMQDHTQSKMDTRQRLTLSYSAYNDKEDGVRQVFSEEADNLSQTLKELDMEAFFKAADALAQAKRVVILCARSAVGLGLFFQYYLKLSVPQVYLIQDFQNNEELLGSLGKEDVVFSLSFKRYAARTVRLTEYASRKDCFIIALTDFMTSPLIRYSDCYLLARTRLFTYLDSFIAPQAIINALLITLGRRKNKALEKHFAQMENIWSEMEVFME